VSVVEIVALLVAGMLAGTINTVVGSGTLITFPVLLLFGYPAVVANVTNTVGLVPGGLAGIHGYRAELRGHGATLRRLAPMSFVGAVIGALLLLVLPPAAFAAIVPVLIGLALVLVLLGPWLQMKAAGRHADAEDGRRHTHRMLLLRAGMLLAGMYGGYFGAAQGVLMMGLMSVLLTDPLQSLNAVKNVLGTIVNAVAAVTFMVVAWDRIEWPVAALLAVGGIAGGYLGARVGRRLPPPVLRGVIVLIGVVAITKMVFFS
jgi:uncharacterized membrane protein YfcA